MKACMTASGGAMLIPDTIARKTCKKSYKALVEEKPKSEVTARPLFFKPRPEVSAEAEAA